MFPTFAPWTKLLESTEPSSTGVGPLVAVMVVLILLVLKDASGGVTDDGASRLGRGLTIAAVPLVITFLMIAAAQLMIVVG